MTTAIGSPRAAGLDLAGVLTSALCIVHCLAAPVAAGALATAGIALWDERPTHVALTVAILVIAIIALVPGWRRHRQVLPLALAALGVVALIASVTVAEAISHDAEPILTVLGGGVMITAHVLNRLFDRRRLEGYGDSDRQLLQIAHHSIKGGAR
jgi:hypothetical protein